MTPTKSERHSALLEVVNRGSAHTQQEIAQALARRGVRVTQATISRDIQELGLVRSGAGYRSSAALVRELVLSIELVDSLAVVKTPPGTANLVARRIDESGLTGIRQNDAIQDIGATYNGIALPQYSIAVNQDFLTNRGISVTLQRAAGQLCLQRTRSDARTHDSGRFHRPLRFARGPGSGQNIHLEVRRAERNAVSK